jgi:hypothetical protein
MKTLDNKALIIKQRRSLGQVINDYLDNTRATPEWFISIAASVLAMGLVSAGINILGSFFISVSVGIFMLALRVRS